MVFIPVLEKSTIIFKHFVSIYFLETGQVEGVEASDFGIRKLGQAEIFVVFWWEMLRSVTSIILVNKER